jgi:hypothetical protein
MVEHEDSWRVGVECQEKDRVLRGRSRHLAQGGEQEVFVLEDGGLGLDALGGSGKVGCSIVFQVVNNVAAEQVGLGVLQDLMFSVMLGEVVAGAASSSFSSLSSSSPSHSSWSAAWSVKVVLAAGLSSSVWLVIAAHGFNTSVVILVFVGRLGGRARGRSRS